MQNFRKMIAISTFLSCRGALIGFVTERQIAQDFRRSFIALVDVHKTIEFVYKNANFSQYDCIFYFFVL